MEEKLTIRKKSALKGDDGFRVFSVRLTDITVARLDALANESGRSRNELIGMLIDFALDHCDVVSES